ncbi:hypothetical protein EVAR_81646_1 [Eumeta japonica]|uniref:Uncharacterized protein n=1 Tax=Eumeta variegata TaxID=151549 RepID=A0A4C1V216_EUMVA|nr:hypothetical protein EVAR_81646_1 [Eumeta japonica]
MHCRALSQLWRDYFTYRTPGGAAVPLETSNLNKQTVLTKCYKFGPRLGAVAPPFSVRRSEPRVIQTGLVGRDELVRPVAVLKLKTGRRAELRARTGTEIENETGFKIECGMKDFFLQKKRELFGPDFGHIGNVNCSGIRIGNGTGNNRNRDLDQN